MGSKFHVSGTSTGSNAQPARSVPGRCCSASSNADAPREWPAGKVGLSPMISRAAKTSAVNH